MVKSTTTTTYGELDITHKKGSASHIEKSYGLTFPIGKNTKKGFFNKESGIALMKNNLKQLLQAEKGERAMSNFGVSLKKFLFEPMDEITFQRISEEVLYQVGKYMPQLEILKLNVRSLDKYGSEGYQGLNIVLFCRLKKGQGEMFETKVGIT